MGHQLRSRMVVAAALTLSAGAALLSAGASTRPNTRRLAAPGCAAHATHDSLDFVDLVHQMVTDTSAANHGWSLLPTSPSDSVRWAGTAIQCDTVAVRIQRFISAQQSDTLWPLIPVLLLRAGPTRWVADPHVGDGKNVREYVVLDSSLTVLKILKVMN